MSTADESREPDGLSSGLDDVHIEEDAVEDDNDLAVKGINLLLNNHWAESLEHFNKHKSQSVVMQYGGAFVGFVQGW